MRRASSRWDTPRATRLSFRSSPVMRPSLSAVFIDGTIAGSLEFVVNVEKAWNRDDQ